MDTVACLPTMKMTVTVLLQAGHAHSMVYGVAVVKQRSIAVVQKSPQHQKGMQHRKKK